jgi:hypothetical protein
VVSSQAFSREFPKGKMDIDRAMAWLANGLGDAVPGFVKGAATIEGAIYHLTDNEWVMPALRGMSAKGSLVCAFKPPGETVNATAEKLLKNSGLHVDERSKTAIMHDKFVVREPGSEDRIWSEIQARVPLCRQATWTLRVRCLMIEQ